MEQILNQLKSDVTATPKKRRPEMKAETRLALLASAKELFANFGYHGTNLRDIAHAAGLSTGAFFANFSGKDEVYAEIYGHAPYTPEQAREFKAQLDALTAGAPC